MKEEAMTTWDWAQKAGADSVKKEITVKTILKFPKWTDADIASFVEIDIKTVKAIRKSLKRSES